MKKTTTHAYKSYNGNAYIIAYNNDKNPYNIPHYNTHDNTNNHNNYITTYDNNINHKNNNNNNTNTKNYQV